MGLALVKNSFYWAPLPLMAGHADIFQLHLDSVVPPPRDDLPSETPAPPSLQNGLFIGNEGHFADFFWPNLPGGDHPPPPPTTGPAEVESIQCKHCKSRLYLVEMTHLEICLVAPAGAILRLKQLFDTTSPRSIQKQLHLVLIDFDGRWC